MKNIILNIKNMKKKELLVLVINALIFLYYLIGIFPVTRFETDSMAIANACEEMIQSGKFEENVLGHSYHMQSGTYFLIVTLSKTFGTSAFISYSILTIFFAFIYWIFLFLVLRKITNENPILIIIILFLFQEIFILSYYANSAVIASAFWIMAFYIIWNKNDNLSFIISALLLALAMWFRIDVAFTYPSVFFILYLKEKNIKAAIIKSVVLAVIVVPVTLFLMYLMNANVGGFLGYTEYHGELFGTEHNLGLLDLHVIKAHAAYFSVLILFMISLACIILLRNKEFFPIFFLISGIIFYYLLGINNTIAPKHLSYFTFFWSLPILFSFKFYKKFKKSTRILVISTAIFIFIIQYVIGVRFEINSIPYQFEEYSTLNPEPTILTLGSISLNKSSIQKAEFVIGAGTKISTADELSASSGLIFTPVTWYKQKQGLYQSFRKLSEIIHSFAGDTLYFIVSDGSTQFVLNNLLTNGFSWLEKTIDFTSDEHHFTFLKSGLPTVIVKRYSLTKDNLIDFIHSIKEKNNINYFIFIWDWQNYYMIDSDIIKTKMLSNHIHKLN